MRILASLGNAVLTAAAAVGVACALVWGATAAGLIQPLVVVSGSMEPGIATGDLLVATRTPVAELEVGDVATLRSATTGHLVTHRVTEVAVSGESAEIRMRGDANPAVDAETYRAEGSVWEPALRIPGGGFAVEVVTRPSVAIPLLVSLAALVGLTLVPSAPPREGGRHVAPRAGADRPEVMAQ